MGHAWSACNNAGTLLGYQEPTSPIVSAFVHRHPTIQMLALSFLILIGVMLVAEGVEKHIERGYIYFAMVFALAVELLNQRVRKQHAAAPDDRRAVPPVAPLAGPGG